MLADTTFTNNSLELKQLTGGVESKALFKNLNVRLESGQLLRISGDNGTGKSTLLRIITGLMDADAGEVLWNRININQSSDYPLQVSYVGHRDGLKPDLTALENLAFYQQLYCLQHVDKEKLLLQLDLLDYADTLIQHLSFGQRRRLALLRLLMSKRALWVLDEPFTGIDQAGRLLLEQLFTAYLNQGGIIIMSHHGTFEANGLAQFETNITL